MTKQSPVHRDILTAALAGLQAQQKTIDEHIAAVRELLATGPKRRGRPLHVQASGVEPAQATVSRKSRRGKMSADTRKRLAEAMRKRWAAARKAGRTALA